MKQIICMKWGNKYPALYVDKLYGMVARHLTGPFRFVCLTDQPQGIRPEVECMDCPTVPIPPPRNNQGWRKVVTSRVIMCRFAAGPCSEPAN